MYNSITSGDSFISLRLSPAQVRYINDALISYKAQSSLQVSYEQAAIENIPADYSEDLREWEENYHFGRREEASANELQAKIAQSAFSHALVEAVIREGISREDCLAAFGF